MRKHVSEVIAWLNHEVAHPSRNWQGLCQQSARSAWGLSAFGASAKIAFHKIPAKHVHESKPKDVPAGAICYDPNLGKYGHAWIADGKGGAYSTDYTKRGVICHTADGALTHWTKKHTVTWVDATPYGPLPLDK